jgi:hypothetical protein
MMMTMTTFPAQKKLKRVHIISSSTPLPSFLCGPIRGEGVGGVGKGRE